MAENIDTEAASILPEGHPPSPPDDLEELVCEDLGKAVETNDVQGDVPAGTSSAASWDDAEHHSADDSPSDEIDSESPG